MAIKVFNDLEGNNNELLNWVGGGSGGGGSSRVLIEEQILSTTATSVSFSSIPQDYTHLELECIAGTDRVNTQDFLVIAINGDTTASNYNAQQLIVNNGVVSGALSDRVIGTVAAVNSDEPNKIKYTSITLFEYTRTDIYKAFRGLLNFNASGGGANRLTTDSQGLWYDVSAITSIDLTPNTGPNFIAGSEFRLYGITDGASGGSGGSGGGYAEDIGDGVTTNIVVNHNLGSRDVSVTVYEAGSPYKEVGVDTEHTDDNNVTLLFTVAPTTDQYRVFVTSGGGAGGSSGREVLTANRTYYVATTGSDSNDGLTVGNPFLTIQKAIDVAAALDSSIYDVDIQVADGTYALSTELVAKTMVGSGSITIEGNVATPGNVIIQDDTVLSIELFGMRDVYTTYTLKGIRFNDTGVGLSRLIWTQSAILFMEDMEFYGNGTGYAVRGQTNSRVTGNSTDWAFSGSFGVVLSAENGATVGMNNSSVTMVSTPNWTGNGFAVAQRSAAAVFFFSVTVNGTATGKRFTSDNHGAVQTFGQPTTFLPGDVAGTADAATFALYG